MEKFEYKAFGYLYPNGEEYTRGLSIVTEQQLNPLGKEGWEIISIDIYKERVAGMMKRRIEK